MLLFDMLINVLPTIKLTQNEKKQVLKMGILTSGMNCTIDKIHCSNVWNPYAFIVVNNISFIYALFKLQLQPCCKSH